MSIRVKYVSLCSSMCRVAVVLTTGLLLLVMSACYNHPVRNLASDVGMIKAGVTTRKEALSLLGDPDFTRKVSAATEEWEYQEEDKTVWQRTPVVGGAFSSSGNKTVILTVEGDIVTAARFGSFDKHEFDWQDDYSWQKKHQKPEQKTDNK